MKKNYEIFYEYSDILIGKEYPGQNLIGKINKFQLRKNLIKINIPIEKQLF